MYHFCGIMRRREEIHMDKKEFSMIRSRLGKTQSQMASLLGTSLKAVQSFEQGWRNVSVPIERQMLFLLMQKASKNHRKPCWQIEKCPMETREHCPAWEFQSGDLCWFINGTICHGESQEKWSDKMKLCRECQVLKSTLETVKDPG